MNPTLSNLLAAIDRQKAQLDAARPLPEETVASLREVLTLDWTYNSNAIEGNTLTLQETKVLLEGITVGGKTLREHLEATNTAMQSDTSRRSSRRGSRSRNGRSRTSIRLCCGESRIRTQAGTGKETC
ncbi:hypothetical protein [Paraburkholderia humisilvae]|uniref:Fic/DOC N-terminal domain-containing protein n=1 Tax=Paraburkholderia humisilvae TaxID=627669 RepID=A0A6J5DF17_9BURK|nr:hypothetical protein [Paraburkholderia humisilvae]CAB3752014.1 hypothetical protein LMG29542_01645 [Paraburkholderia humisilvae]